MFNIYDVSFSFHLFKGAQVAEQYISRENDLMQGYSFQVIISFER